MNRALLPEIKELVELADLLRNFLQTELESGKLRQMLGKDRSLFTESLSTKLQELDLASAFSQSGSPESGLPGLAQLAFECGRALMPLPVWENIMAGPYLHGQLKWRTATPEAPKLAGNMEVVLPVIASQIKRPIRGISSAHWLLAIEEDTATLHRIDKARVSLVNEELDLLGVYGELKGEFEPGNTEILPPGFLDTFRLLVAAELGGICSKVVEMTVDYLKIRKQFEVPIGGFQAVQHKAADMHLHTEAISSLVAFALRSHSKDLKEFALACQSALSYACDHACAITESAIQLHGGIGFTWEHDLHLYLRRAKRLETNHKLSERDLDQLVQNL